jgi:hypothetical protein
MSPAVDDLTRRRRKRFRAKHALGLDPGVGTGSREENASETRDQRPHEGIAVDAMLPAGVPRGVKTGDWTADTVHPEFEECADRSRGARHDIVDQIVRRNWHMRLRSCANDNADRIGTVCPGAISGGSLLEHDLGANAFRVCREGKPVPTHRVTARGHAFPDHESMIRKSMHSGQYN